MFELNYEQLKNKEENILDNALDDFKKEVEAEAIDIKADKGINRFIDEYTDTSLTTYKQQQDWFVLAYHNNMYQPIPEGIDCILDVVASIAYQYLHTKLKENIQDYIEKNYE